MSGRGRREMHSERRFSRTALLADDCNCPHVNLRTGAHVNTPATAGEEL
jgi:hypothetical protein